MFDLAPDVRFWRSCYRWKACATLFLKVLGSRETELWLEKYDLTNRGHRSIFGPSEGIFLTKIPARPGKILTIWEFHTVSEHVFFPMHPGSQINSLWFRKTLCASEATSGEKLWDFQHSLISVRMVDVAPDIRFWHSWCRRKACVTFYLKVRALHRGELGFARYDLVNRGRWNVPHAGGHFLIEISAWPEELLTIRELHVVAEVTLLLKGFSLRTKLPPVGKNPRTNVVSQIDCFVNNT